MGKIKIVHIVESLEIGGLEKVVENICLHFDKNKYDMRVYCVASGGEIASYLETRGIPVKVLGIDNCYNPINILKLYRELKEDKPHIVQTHGYFSSVIGRTAGLLAGVKVLINHVHTTFHGLKPRNVLIDKFLNNFTDAVIYVSKASRKSFFDAGYSLKKTYVVYNGVPGEKDKTRGKAPEDKVLSIVASLRAVKGHKYLLKAMVRVIEDLPDLKLWIVGDGPLRKDLESEAVRLGIEKNIIFLGKRNDVREILEKTSVFVMASLREGLPVALVEALAMGLPVIGTNVGGIPEVITSGENGFVIPARDEKALAGSILDVFKDPGSLAAMGRRSREKFNKVFSLDIMFNTLDELYRDLLVKN